MVEEYPFPEQDLIVGRLSYEEESAYTAGRTIPVDFEYRAESNLFLTEVQTDVSSIDSIITQFGRATSDALQVYRNLHAAEDALWDFLMSADRILEITVLDDGKEVPYDEVEDCSIEEVVGEYAIESASVGYSERGNDIFVKYHGGGLQVETNWEDGREYVIQLFEREVLAK